MYVDVRHSNDISLSKDEFYKLGLSISYKLLFNTSSRKIRQSWKRIFKNRNSGYGVYWIQTGIRGQVGAIYTKYYRYLEGNKFDCLRDIFGYTIMILALMQKMGCVCSDINDVAEAEIDAIYQYAWMNDIVDDRIFSEILLGVFKRVVSVYERNSLNT